MQRTANEITGLKLSQPAHRALSNAGISTFKQLAKFSEAEILKLHGIGKSAIPPLKKALRQNGFTFRKNAAISEKPKKPETIDEYLAVLEPNKRKALGSLRKAIKTAAPKAEEKISYNLPFYRQNGHLAAFVSQKNHLSFVTMSAAVIRSFKDNLKNFKVSGTTIHFQPLSPIPSTLVKKIIKARIKENEKKLIKTKKNNK